MDQDYEGDSGDMTVQAIVKRANQIWEEDSARRERYTALAMRYYSDAFLLDPATAMGLVNSVTVRSHILDDPPTYAVGRSHVDAAVAKIAGVNKPGIQFMTTRANWRQRRAVDQLEQFALGIFSSPCEQFEDVWALRRSTARDAMMLGDGVERIYFDPTLGRATFGRVLPWELLFDPEDGYDGNPSCCWYRYPADRKSVKAMFPKKKAAICDAPSPSESDRPYIPGSHPQSVSSLKSQVLLVEFWELPCGDAPGRHVLATGDGSTLIDEEWKLKWFPFNIFHWVNPSVGVWGASLLEQSRKLEAAINRMVEKIVNSIDNTSTNVVVAEKGQLTDLTTAFLKENSVVLYNHVANAAGPPQVTTPQAFNPQILNTVDNLYGRSFDLSGISEMAATAQKQPGLEANAAIQTMADLQSERFGVQASDFQAGFPALARKAIMITKGQVEKSKARVSVPGDRFLNSVDWPETDVEEDMFHVKLQASPTSRWTLAGRIQKVEALGQAGVLSPDIVARVQQYGDAPGELDTMNRQDEYIGRIIDRWMGSNEKQRATNRFRPEEEDSPLLLPPVERALDIPRAISFVGPAYLEALFDEVPDEILELFITWINMAEQVEKEKNPPQPPAPPPAQGQPPQPPMPAPPMA